MSKRLILVLAIVGLLAAGITGGAVLAQDSGAETGVTEGETVVLPENDGPDGEPARLSFAARVAAALGLEPEAVESAFQRARREQQDEKHKKRLDRLVSKGRLTEEQAAEQYTWFQARPDSSSGIFPGAKRRGHGTGFQRFSKGRHPGMGMIGPRARWRPMERGFFPWHAPAKEGPGQQPSVAEESPPATTEGSQ